MKASLAKIATPYKIIVNLINCTTPLANLTYLIFLIFSQIKTSHPINATTSLRVYNTQKRSFKRILTNDQLRRRLSMPFSPPLCIARSRSLLKAHVVVKTRSYNIIIWRRSICLIGLAVAAQNKAGFESKRMWFSGTYSRTWHIVWSITIALNCQKVREINWQAINLL